MTTRHSEPAPETMSPAEARTVLEHVAREDMSVLPRVEDVAETLRLESDDVRALLAKVRAAPPATVEKPRLNPLALAGWAVAAIALAWAALRPAPPVAAAPPTVAALPGPGLAKPPMTVVVFPMDLMPPAGYAIGVRVHGVVLSLAGRRDVRPGPVAEVKRQLVDAASLLVQRAEEIGMENALSPSEMVAFDTLRPDAEVWINGPAGTHASFPLPTEMHMGPSSNATYKGRLPGIEAAIDGLFASGRSGAESGTPAFTFPPSGFDVRFSGRRRAGAIGGPVAVPGFDAADARDRLVRAMRGMLDADLKPLDGRWRQDRDKERALETPGRSRFVVETFDDRLEFEVPTRPGTPRAAQDAILRAKAAEAVAAYLKGGT